mmetsp:Transcript_1836/g.6042  ORF Transcript_1836/g.6042 Transcript_1836/m.6042 type:complete len:203 (-) Transcript_1836:280-888(-)
MDSSLATDGYMGHTMSVYGSAPHDSYCTGRRQGSRRRMAAAMAAKLRPSPPSLPKDQTTTHGWLRSRATMRSPRATYALSHAGRLARKPSSLRTKKAVGLHVGLVGHVEAEGVAEVVPRRGVRVVRRAHRVEVEALHQLCVELHERLGDGLAACGAVVVAVDAADGHGAPVDAELGAEDAALAHAHPGRLHVHRGPLVVLEN